MVLYGAANLLDYLCCDLLDPSSVIKGGTISVSPKLAVERKKWRHPDIFIFLGALTHIIWDSFTHDTGAVVRHFTFLKSNLNIMTDSQEIAIYKLLQHAGSLFGALYLCYKYWQYHYRQSQENQWENIHRLKNLFVIAIISAFLAAPLAYYLVPKEPHLHINRLVYLELTLAVPFFFGLLTVFALWKQYTLITVNEK